MKMKDINKTFNKILKLFEKELTFEDVLKRDKIELYAGDLVDRIEKNNNDNLVGLVIHKGDMHSVHHDITWPYPLPDNCVYSYQSEDVFEHIELKKMPQVLKEIYRILEPGACLRMSVPDYKHHVQINRSVLKNGKIVFDPFGGGEYVDGKVRGGGHVWFPTYEIVRKLLEDSPFKQYEFFHYYDENGIPVRKEIDYTKGWIKRTPDHIGEQGAISIVVDCYK